MAIEYPKMVDPSCVFCRELAGSRDTNFARLYPEMDSRVILRTEHFVVMPCIGQLVPRHCIMIPLTHNSTIAMAVAANGTVTEIMMLISQFETSFVHSNERLIVFEHGARGVADGGCGIYHAHLHLVPTDKSLQVEQICPIEAIQKYTNLDDALKAAVDSQPYILLGINGGGYCIAPLVSPLPSQYLRQRVALSLGLSEWDWRSFGRQESLIQILLEHRVAGDSSYSGLKDKAPASVTA